MLVKKCDLVFSTVWESLSIIDLNFTLLNLTWHVSEFFFIIQFLTCCVAAKYLCFHLWFILIIFRKGQERADLAIQIHQYKRVLILRLDFCFLCLCNFLSHGFTYRNSSCFSDQGRSPSLLTPSYATIRIIWKPLSRAWFSEFWVSRRACLFRKSTTWIRSLWLHCWWRWWGNLLFTILL